MASGGEQGAELSAAQRARSERQRQRARALRDQRQARGPGPGPAPAGTDPLRARDTGGGFLLEPEPERAAPGLARGGGARSAPAVHASEQPRCEVCAAPFPQSALWDAFGCAVCDACRDEAGAHALLARTEAKAEFLLQDCDLDAREPPLRCVERRNPHRPHGAPMRLYLRAHLEARAALVWGSAEALAEERARREARRERAAGAAAARRLRELRLAARSSLATARLAPRAHAHRWAAEARAPDDTYSRACLDCGHIETYEKM